MGTEKRLNEPRGNFSLGASGTGTLTNTKNGNCLGEVSMGWVHENHKADKEGEEGKNLLAKT